MQNAIHIGQLIRQEMERQERTPAWLAAKINCTRTNVHKIFLRSSIDTELLARISVALQYNFFQFLSAELKRQNIKQHSEYEI